MKEIPNKSAMTDKNTDYELNQKIEIQERELSVYRSLVENSPDLFYRTDMNGLISFISPSVLRLSGYTVEEAVGMNMAEEVYLVPEERRTFLNVLKETGKVDNFVARLKRKDGSIWWASTNAHFCKDQEGNITGIEGITRDISELVEKEKALEESEERFRVAFHTNPDSINLNRVSDGLYFDINEGFTELTGYTREDVIGRTSLEINIWKNPEDRQRLVDLLLSAGRVVNMEAQFVKKNGEIADGLMSARIIKINNEDYIQSVTKEITETKQLQQQILQYQKLEALGTLAGGIAHDFKNLIGAIINYAQLILLHSGDNQKINNFANKLITAGDQATRLVHQILDFSHQGNLKKSPTDIGQIVIEALKLIKVSIPSSIAIKHSIDSTAFTAMANSDQIHQVIMNLCLNASQAIDGNGGEIDVKLADFQIEEKTQNDFQNLAPGKYLSLTVSDSGHGMDHATMARIFEPFFTTKKKGIGTGMGLATVHGIIKNHRGDIRVTSDVGKGTTFQVLLPGLY